MNKAKTSLIERGVGKHPLLRPELIVVNDQLTGFKKIKKKLEALEELQTKAASDVAKVLIGEEPVYPIKA